MQATSSPAPSQPCKEFKNQYEHNKAKDKIYLRMITMAICEESNNRGTLRKQIWSYLQKEFNNSVEYRDFLFSIQNLEKAGMIKNKTGYFFVE
jgi:hypothetical protein